MAAGIVMGFDADRLVQEAKENPKTEHKNTVYDIGICQLVQHEALDEATQGFKDKLSEKLDGRVTFDEQNATNDIPIVGTSITDYATALDIEDWTGITGINVTGSSDLAPLAEQAAMFKALLPDAKNIGILYCSGEANSKYQVDVITKELEKLGYICTNYSFIDSNEVASVVSAACSESDALYVPTDNTAAANAELIANIAEPANVPIITGEEGPCKICGIATLSIDYYSIGEIAGEMAYEILENGKKPAEMEIRFAENLTPKYNPELVGKFGITVPDGYEPLTAE